MIPSDPLFRDSCNRIVEINFNKHDSQPLIVEVGIVGFNLQLCGLIDNGAMVSLISDSEIDKLPGIKLVESDINGIRY